MKSFIKSFCSYLMFTILLIIPNLLNLNTENYELLTINKMENYEKMNLSTENKLYNFNEIMAPVWSGDTAYNESILVVAKEDGSIDPITMLYNIDEIITVKSASLLQTYTEGDDYKVENGKLIILPNGNIPIMDYDLFHPTTGTAGFEDRDGGYVQWKEGSWYHSRQIVVTYKHSDGYSGIQPQGKANLLPRSITKLKNKEQFNILFYGDSITTGANSSGIGTINASPYMDIYPELIFKQLKQTYEYDNIKLTNTAVGGTDSTWGMNNVKDRVIAYDADLVVIAFGMNDTLSDASTFSVTVNKIINAVKRYKPDCEFIIVATMLPNYNAERFYGNQYKFKDELLKLETESIAVADVTTVHQDLLSKKKYADMTGNNINHPNDYLARVYAQVMIKTFEEADNKLNDDETPAITDKAKENGCKSNISINITNSSILFIILMLIIKTSNKLR